MRSRASWAATRRAWSCPSSDKGGSSVASLRMGRPWRMSTSSMPLPTIPEPPNQAPGSPNGGVEASHRRDRGLPCGRKRGVMKDKVVVVTGAFGVLGQALARKLARRGAKVAAVDMAAQPPAALVADLGESALMLGG